MSQVSGPGTVIFGSASALSTSATADLYGTYVIQWEENNNGCKNASTITVNYYQPPVAVAGVGGNECDLDFLLNATPSAGVGTWTQFSGPGTTVFNNANSPNATATVDVYGPYVFRWTEVNGYAGCTSGANVTVNFYQSPTSTIAAGSGNVCGLVQTVAATLTTGSGGTWSQVSGPGTVTFGSASALSTSATADLYGTYVIQWEENNNGCKNASTITVNYYQPPVAVAGVGGNECDLDFLLNATPSAGVGTWTQVSGPGTTVFNNANSPNATATVDVYGPYVFRWTEVNGYAGCTSGANVTVNFYQSPTSTIVAGSGNVCGLVQTVAATLTTGSGGTWSQVSGPGTVTFGSASALSTSATADLYGTYVIQWEENNNGCKNASTITVNYYQPPVAVAGVGGNECDLDFY